MLTIRCQFGHYIINLALTCKLGFQRFSTFLKITADVLPTYYPLTKLFIIHIKIRSLVRQETIGPKYRVLSSSMLLLS